MIDLKPRAQPHMPLETRIRVQPPIPLEEAEPCEGPHGVPIMPIAECNT